MIRANESAAAPAIVGFRSLPGKYGVGVRECLPHAVTGLKYRQNGQNDDKCGAISAVMELMGGDKKNKP